MAQRDQTKVVARPLAADREKRVEEQYDGKGRYVYVWDDVKRKYVARWVPT